MFAGTALSVRLFVYAGLSLFIIYGPYLYVVVCVLYAYKLTEDSIPHSCHCSFSFLQILLVSLFFFEKTDSYS